SSTTAATVLVVLILLLDEIIEVLDDITLDGARGIARVFFIQPFGCFVHAFADTLDDLLATLLLFLRLDLLVVNGILCLFFLVRRLLAVMLLLRLRAAVVPDFRLAVPAGLVLRRGDEGHRHDAGEQAERECTDHWTSPLGFLSLFSFELSASGRVSRSNSS